MLQVPEQVPPAACGDARGGAGATSSPWKGPQWSRYDLQAVEDHGGAGGRCEEEGAAVLTSTPSSPSQGGGRGVGSEGVRLSLGKERRGKVVF